MIIAATEPAKLRSIASSVSLLPERFGCDIFFIGAGGRKVGIQRKEIKDLLASVNDGRLQKEVLQMGSLDYSVVIIEGRENWSIDGFLLNQTFGQQWNRSAYDGLKWSIQDRVGFLHLTEGLDHTIETVQRMQTWFKKSSHESLSRRPKFQTSIFGGEEHSKEAAAWILQSVPGVGSTLAKRIVEKYGLPLKLTVGIDELVEVEGLGKKKAEVIVQMFGEMDEA